MNSGIAWQPVMQSAPEEAVASAADDQLHAADVSDKTPVEPCTSITVEWQMVVQAAGVTAAAQASYV